jgi:beta-phosphoglucomutase-like phosphatase (HAD superfamily)
MSLRALIFGLDGTLADTEEAHRQALNGGFAMHWGRRIYAELLNVLEDASGSRTSLRRWTCRLASRRR